ncbi:MAG: ABC transporter ATP-binding protein [Oscillospiraceae bacterium]|nr:ABC transporter ATP-binding protein [Oscillospiraceae bacterium]
MKIFRLKKDFEKFSLNIDSLDMSEQKIYGIIGPNGCGKTTAMKLMAGIMQPDSGVVDSGGLTARDITMVFRKPYLMHESVLKNLLYPLKIRGITPDMQYIEHLLELSGLQALRDTYALTLSGGEQQKLALMRAVVFSPKLVFIDEGFSNMDIESIAVFEEFILKMQAKSKLTWVITSHQLSTIRRLCEHVIFMHAGEVKAQGNTEEILSSPQLPELKQYLQFV